MFRMYIVFLLILCTAYESTGKYAGEKVKAEAATPTLRRMTSPLLDSIPSMWTSFMDQGWKLMGFRKSEVKSTQVASSRTQVEQFILPSDYPSSIPTGVPSSQPSSSFPTSIPTLGSSTSPTPIPTQTEKVVINCYHPHMKSSYACTDVTLLKEKRAKRKPSQTIPTQGSSTFPTPVPTETEKVVICYNPRIHALTLFTPSLH